MPDPLTEPRWTLLYDADCGFCKWTVARFSAWDRRHRLEPLAIQGSRGQQLLPDLTPDERLASVHLVAPDGRRFSAGAALAPLLRQLPGGAIPARLLERFPGLANRGYDWVAAHRTQLGRLVPRRRRGGR